MSITFQVFLDCRTSIEYVFCVFDDLIDGGHSDSDVMEVGLHVCFARISLDDMWRPK